MNTARLLVLLLALAALPALAESESTRENNDFARESAVDNSADASGGEDESGRRQDLDQQNEEAFNNSPVEHQIDDERKNARESGARTEASD